MQPPRQEIEEEHSEGGLRKKVQFHKPNYFWDGGEKNITAITAPGTKGREEKEVVKEQRGAGGGRSRTKGTAQLSKSSNIYAHISKYTDTLFP